MKVIRGYFSHFLYPFFRKDRVRNSVHSNAGHGTFRPGRHGSAPRVAAAATALLLVMLGVALFGSPANDAVAQSPEVQLDRTVVIEGETATLTITHAPAARAHFIRLKPFSSPYTASASDLELRGDNDAAASAGAAVSVTRASDGAVEFSVVVRSDDLSDPGETFGVQLCSSATECSGDALLGEWTLTINEPAATQDDPGEGLIDDDLGGSSLDEVEDGRSVLDFFADDGTYRMQDGDDEIPLRLLNPPGSGAASAQGAQGSANGTELSALAANAGSAYAPPADDSAKTATPSNWLVSDTGQMYLLVGGVNVIFESRLSETQIQAIWDQHGVPAERVSPIGELPNAYLIQTVSDVESLSLVDALSATPGVDTAVPNLFTPHSIGPVPTSLEYPAATTRARQRCAPYTKMWDDELSACLWHLNADTNYQSSRGDNPSIDINLGNVWETTMGAGVTVAVLDSTWEATHEDLKDNVDAARSKIRGGHTGEPQDSEYPPHGTAVAGIIGARDNKVGGRGVAPRATLVNYNVLDASTASFMAEALTGNMQTVSVYNMSYGPADLAGLYRAHSFWRRAVNLGIGKGMGFRGVSYVKAAGNGTYTTGSNWATLDESNNHMGVISVCAVNGKGKSSYYSEDGPSLWVCAPAGGDELAILAPIGKNGYTVYFNGTSAAAPMVSGVIALMRSVNAELTWRDVKMILANTAQKNDPNHHDWMTGANRYGSTAEKYSFNHEYGFGTVDAKAAVTAASGWTLLPHLSSAQGRSETTVSLPQQNSEITLNLGLRTTIDFTEHVEVIIDIDSVDVRDYRWTLVSPSGAESILAPEFISCSGKRCSMDGSFDFGSSRHLGEDPNGVWKLKVKRFAQNLPDCSTGNGTGSLTPSAVCTRIGLFNEQIRQWEIIVVGHTTVSGQPVQLSVSPLSVTEGDEVDVSVTVTGAAPTQDLVIPLLLTADTASAPGSAGADYGSLASITIPAGSLTASAKIATTSDDIDEPDETFTIGFGSLPAGYKPAGSASTVTIVDDDTPEVSIVGGSGVTEGGDATFTITASPAPAANLDVSVTVSQSGDYGAATGQQTVTIPTIGSVTLTVSTTNDDADEADGTVTATLDTPAADAGYTVSANQGAATVSVADDDAAAGYTVDPQVVANVKLWAAETHNGAEHVNRWQRVLVAFGVLDASGVSGVVMSASEAQGYADRGWPRWVPVVAELTALEASQQDPLTTPEVSITAGSGVTEGGDATFTVTSSPAPAANLDVSVTVSQSGDYGAATGQQTVTIPSAGSATLTVGTANDDADEADGSVTATLDTPAANAGYTVSSAAGSASVAVADDDVPAPPGYTVDAAVVAQVKALAAQTYHGTAHVNRWNRVLVAFGEHDGAGVTGGAMSAAEAQQMASTPNNNYVPVWNLVVAELTALEAAAAAQPEISIVAGAGVTEGGDATFDLTASPAPAANLDVSVTVSQSGDYGATTGQQTVTIPTTGSVTLTVGTTNDGADEADGSVTATLDTPAADAGYTVSSSQGAATVSVADDDTPEVSIVSGSGVTEGGDATFTITANPAPAANLDVSVTVSQSGDYGAATGSRTVTIPTAGSVTLTVGTTNDGADEADGAVTATVNSGSGYTVSSSQGAATVSVADDDVPEVSISAGSGVTEGGDATFTITASPTPSASLDVSVTVSQSGDYGATTGSRTVTIPTAGSVTLTVGTTNDQVDEANGSVTATLVDGSDYDLGATTTATVDVADDDPATPTTEETDQPALIACSNLPTISVSDAEALPSDRSADFTISLDCKPSRPVTAYYAHTREGSITGGVKIARLTSSEPYLTVSVEINGTRRLEVRVMYATGAANYRAKGSLSIVSERTSPVVVTPEISIVAGGDIIEGADATFALSASPAPTAALPVSVSVTASGDYGVGVATHTVTLPTSGAASLALPTTNDQADEADGAVTATLNAGNGYTVSSAQSSGTVTVADDDDSAPVIPVVSISAGADVTEGGGATFTVSAHPAPSANLAVSVTVSASGDYGATTGAKAVTIPTSGSATFTVGTTNDDADEADGSVTATLDTPAANAGYTVSATQGAATVSVADDDDPPPPTTPEVSVTAGSGVTEGGDATFTVTSNPAPAANLDVSVTVSQSGDYGATTGQRTVTIPTAGSVTLTVGTTDDGADEADGSVTATLDTPAADAGYTVSSSQGAATVSVADDDDPPTLLTTPEVSVSAGSGITEGGDASFTVTASPAPASNLDVSVTVSQIGDYGATTGQQTVTIPTTGSATLTVGTTNDGADEADGSVTATLDTPAANAGYTVSASQGAATVSVADDDVPEVSISAGNGVTEGGDASFTITASPAPAASLDVSVTVSQSGDYGAATGQRTVTIPTTGSATLTVGTTDDEADEADGAVTATLDTPAADAGYTVSSSQGAATVSVSDDDVPEISISAGNGVTEGGDASFTITSSPAPAASLDVSVTVSQSGDYGATTGQRTVTIPTTGSVTLTVGTTDDGADEADGSVTATLDTPAADAGYTVSATQGAATVTVADDDAPEPEAKISVTVEDASGTEGDVVEFRILLSHALTEKFEVTWLAGPAYHVRDDRAHSGDYQAMSGVMTFKPGVTALTGVVWLNDDSKDEPDEYFAVEAYLPGEWFKPASVGTMTIVDDD